MFLFPAIAGVSDMLDTYCLAYRKCTRMWPGNFWKVVMSLDTYSGHRSWFGWHMRASCLSKDSDHSCRRGSSWYQLERRCSVRRLVLVSESIDGICDPSRLSDICMRCHVGTQARPTYGFPFVGNIKNNQSRAKMTHAPPGQPFVGAVRTLKSECHSEKP